MKNAWNTCAWVSVSLPIPSLYLFFMDVWGWVIAGSISLTLGILGLWLSSRKLVSLFGAILSLALFLIGAHSAWSYRTTSTTTPMTRLEAQRNSRIPDLPLSAHDIYEYFNPRPAAFIQHVRFQCSVTEALAFASTIVGTGNFRVVTRPAFIGEKAPIYVADKIPWFDPQNVTNWVTFHGSRRTIIVDEPNGTVYMTVID